MNNELTKNTFSGLTTADIAALAKSNNLDDMQLADRLATRLVLTVRQARGVLGDAAQQLADLVEVTDADLARI
jgi:hypothetical protein